MQHELIPRLGIDVGYFRRWFGNFQVTQLRGLTAADFDRYSVTAATADCLVVAAIASRISTTSTRRRLVRVRHTQRWRATSVTRANTGTVWTSARTLDFKMA